MSGFNDCTLEDVQCALQFIDSNCRDTWVRMGMAIKSEFGAVGFECWNDWSQQASSYKSSAAKSVWSSFKASGAGGAVSIASLFHEAKQSGWEPKQVELTPEQKAVLAKDREDRRLQREIDERKEREAVVRWQALVSAKAVEIWNILKGSGVSPYLGKKKVRDFGIRFASNGLIIHTDEEAETINLISGKQNIDAFFSNKTDDMSFKYIKRGTIAVPLFDEHGALWNLQFIFPSGKKSFLKFGRKSGCFHFISKGGSGHLMTVSTPIVVVEGYATACSAHMAVGWAVVVAFDAGNLVHVARSIRKAYPDNIIVIGGDDDCTVKDNPGKQKAEQAANDVGGVAVLPQFDGVMNG